MTGREADEDRQRPLKPSGDPPGDEEDDREDRDEPADGLDDPPELARPNRRPVPRASCACEVCTTSPFDGPCRLVGRCGRRPRGAGAARGLNSHGPHRRSLSSRAIGVDQFGHAASISLATASIDLPAAEPLRHRLPLSTGTDRGRHRVGRVEPERCRAVGQVLRRDLVDRVGVETLVDLLVRRDPTRGNLDPASRPTAGWTGRSARPARQGHSRTRSGTRRHLRPAS